MNPQVRCMMLYIIITIAIAATILLSAVSRKGKTKRAEGAEARLSIGICDPFTADSILTVIAPYSERHPEFSIYITYADEGKLMSGYNGGSFDAVFVKDGHDAAAKAVRLRRSPLLARYADLPVEPDGDEYVTMHMICRKEFPAVSQLFDDGRLK